MVVGDLLGCWSYQRFEKLTGIVLDCSDRGDWIYVVLLGWVEQQRAIETGPRAAGLSLPVLVWRRLGRNIINNKKGGIYEENVDMVKRE